MRKNAKEVTKKESRPSDQEIVAALEDCAKTLKTHNRIEQHKNALVEMEHKILELFQDFRAKYKIRNIGIPNLLMLKHFKIKEKDYDEYFILEGALFELSRRRVLHSIGSTWYFGSGSDLDK